MWILNQVMLKWISLLAHLPKSHIREYINCMYTHMPLVVIIHAHLGISRADHRRMIILQVPAPIFQISSKQGRKLTWAPFSFENAIVAESCGNKIPWITLISSSLCGFLQDKSRKGKINGTRVYFRSHQLKLGATPEFLVKLLYIYSDPNQKINWLIRLHALNFFLIS